MTLFSLSCFGNTKFAKCVCEPRHCRDINGININNGLFISPVFEKQWGKPCITMAKSTSIHYVNANIPIDTTPRTAETHIVYHELFLCVTGEKSFTLVAVQGLFTRQTEQQACHFCGAEVQSLPCGKLKNPSSLLVSDVREVSQILSNEAPGPSLASHVHPQISFYHLSLIVVYCFAAKH